MTSSPGLFLFAKANAIFDTIFDEDATRSDLLQLAVAMAVVVFLSFEALRPILALLVRGPLRGRMQKISDMEYDRPDVKQFRDEQGIASKEEWLAFSIQYWPQSMLLMIQHTVGGMLALPAVLGSMGLSSGIESSTASSLACFGILVEMGWELQDFVLMIYYCVFGGEQDKKRYPIVGIVIMLMHHSLTCIMGIPMIHAHRTLWILHRLSFDLGGAAGCVSAATELTRALDVTKKDELRKFMSITFLLLLVVLWTRFFDWFYLCYKLLTLFYAEKQWIFLAVGSFICSIFSLFNLAFVVFPMVKRFMKFARKLKEYQALPLDADDIRRGSTILDLQIAAADLNDIDTQFNEHIMHLFEFKERKVERRQTISSVVRVKRTTLRPHRQSMVAWKSLYSMEDKRTGADKRD